MAVSWNSSVSSYFALTNIYSLNTPMFLEIDKDTNNSDYIIEIDLTQGSFTKTITLRYSGLIKTLKIDLAKIIKDYKQPIPGNDGVFISPNYVRNYTNGAGLIVDISVSDDINTITTKQKFIDNMGSPDVNIPESLIGYTPIYWDSWNFYDGDEPIVKIPKGLSDFGGAINIPLFLTLDKPGGLIQTNRLLIQWFELPSEGGALIAQEDITGIIPSNSEEFIKRIEYYKYSETKPGVTIAAYYYGGAYVELIVTEFHFYEPCQTAFKQKVLYSGRFDGLDMLIFSNNKKAFDRKLTTFTLENGDKIITRKTNRNRGILVSEFVKSNYERINYKYFGLAKEQYLLNKDSNDNPIVVKINILDTFIDLKKIDGIDMKQYTFTYEEVSELKY